jgi:hypothetical protein
VAPIVSVTCTLSPTGARAFTAARDDVIDDWSGACADATPAAQLHAIAASDNQTALSTELRNHLMPLIGMRHLSSHRIAGCCSASSPARLPAAGPSSSARLST